MVVFAAYGTLLYLLIAIAIFTLRDKRPIFDFLIGFTWPISLPFLLLLKVLK